MSTVLVTGISGFIGFQVLLQLLNEGYTVRAAVRSTAQAKQFSSHPSVEPYSRNLSFIEVPHFDQPGAYDAALEGITHVIHVAAPLPWADGDPEKDVYHKTMANIQSIFGSIANTPSIQKVIVTSTGLAALPFPIVNGATAHLDAPVPDFPGPYDNGFYAYMSAKTNSPNWIRHFREQHPHLDVSLVYPGFVFGPDARADTAEKMFNTTNGFLLSSILGKVAESPNPTAFSHIEDIARLHVDLLRDGRKGDFGAMHNGSWDDGWKFVKENYSKAVADGVFKEGKQPEIVTYFDTSKTEKELGWKQRSYEQAVVDAAGQYLDLVGAPRA